MPGKGTKQCPICRKRFAIKGLTSHMRSHPTYDDHETLADVTNVKRGKPEEVTNVVVFRSNDDTFHGFVREGGHFKRCNITVLDVKK